jgi:hypothetical protein
MTKVGNEEAFATGAAHVRSTRAYVDLPYYHAFDHYIIVSKTPRCHITVYLYLLHLEFSWNGISVSGFYYITFRAIISYNNISRPFESFVWLCLILFLLLFSLLFWMVAFVYSEWMPNLAKFNLKGSSSRANFLLFTFTKIAEPEPLPWFKEWSAGKKCC